MPSDEILRCWQHSEMPKMIKVRQLTILILVTGWMVILILPICILQLLTTRNLDLHVKLVFFAIPKEPFLRAKVGACCCAFIVRNTVQTCFWVPDLHKLITIHDNLIQYDTVNWISYCDKTALTVVTYLPISIWILVDKCTTIHNVPIHISILFVISQ